MSLRKFRKPRLLDKIEAHVEQLEQKDGKLMKIIKKVSAKVTKKQN